MPKYHKLFFFFCVALFSLSSNSYSQGFYINGLIGYNFSVNGELLFTKSTSSGTEYIYGSYGEGVGYGIGSGYMFNKNIGIELAVLLSDGKDYEVSQSNYYNANYYSSSKAIKGGNMVRMIPGIKITHGDVFKLYARFGVTFSLWKEVNISSEAQLVNNGIITNWNTSEKYSKGESFGISASFGVEYVLSKSFSLLFELNSLSQSWKPEHAEVTAPFGGNIITREVEFDDGESTPQGFTQPVFPFSSFGINTGIQMNF
jgi:hypothetical protein